MKKIFKRIFKKTPLVLITDVEIQKIRQDKINPAYSPAQSEHESPGKLSFFFNQKHAVNENVFL